MMKKYITLLFLLLICAFDARTQTVVDSLRDLLPAAKADCSRVKLSLAHSDAYQTENNDFVRSKHYYTLAGNLNRQIGYTNGIIEYLFDYSDAAIQQEKYDAALTMNKEAEVLAAKEKDSSRPTRAQFNIGVSYSGLANYPAAINYFMKAKDYYERKNRMAKAGLCDNKLIILFRQTKDQNIYSGSKPVCRLSEYAVTTESSPTA